MREDLVQHGLIGGSGEHPVAAGMQLAADEPFHRPPPGVEGVIACLPARTGTTKGALSPVFWGDNE